MAPPPRLNTNQQMAVDHLQGPLLIFAGAGSGKTRVITFRIKRLLESGISPRNIAAVTFTNRSAREMKSRLAAMLPRKSMRGLTVSTFHSLGNRLLRAEIERLPGYRVPFSILAQDETEKILADIYRALKLDPDGVREDGISFLISLCKNARSRPADFARRRMTGAVADLFEDIYRRYHDTLRALNAVDFDDLILLPRRILEGDDGLREQYRKRFLYFLVDEFQDTNPAQYSLLKILLGEENNICVVGDDDQSIYGWRGADMGIILGFQKDFPRAKVVHLDKNYRSTATILEAANAVIANNTFRAEKKMRAVHPGGNQLRLLELADETAEAAETADRIHNMLIRHKRKPADFAILYRTNFQSRLFEQELRRRNIPHHVVGGYRFFDRREVRDLIAYLRVIANPRDELSLKRIINRPRRGIGEGTIEKINARLLEQDEQSSLDFYGCLVAMREQPQFIPGLKGDVLNSLYEFLELLERYRQEFFTARKMAPVLKKLIRDLNFENEFRRGGDRDEAVTARMLNLAELVNMLAHHEEQESEEKPDLHDFLSRLALIASGSEDENPAGRVHLLTLHLAKGLEYPVIFLAGMEEGLFPAERSLGESADPGAALEEERRLFYVGITRAREELFLTRASSRRKFGQTFETEPSRFLAELPPRLLVTESFVDTPREEEKKALTEFMEGLQALNRG